MSEAKIRAAWARRLDHPHALKTDAWRVLNGPADGAPPGVTLDRYKNCLVLAAREDVPDVQVRAWVEAARCLELQGLVLKRVSRQAGASTSQVVWGEVPQQLWVDEFGARLGCQLNDGLQTGLFLDHRDTRQWVRAHATDLEVLNLFAYTGAFSVQAALGGARRVTSVDSSKRALLRGRENMQASGVDPDQHRWFSDDVLEHIGRGKQRYGIVVADPPVLGRAGNKRFELLRDLERLAELLLARTDGYLVFSTHALELDWARLDAAFAGATVVARLGLPGWDHPVAPVAEDRGDYLKTLVLKVGR